MIERRRYMGLTALPYDYEVEYLESTGTQYIDTGYYPDSSLTTIECEIAFFAYNQPVFGCRDSSGSRFWVNEDSWSGVEFGFGDYVPSRYHPEFNSKVSISFNVLPEHQFSADNMVQIEIEFTHKWDIPIYILSANDRGRLLGIGKVYNFKIQHSGELVHDFIPVVKDNIGYMYDKVSGQLFGNAGTGSFIVGPRVTGGG